jgi:hypothetical protein
MNDICKLIFKTDNETHVSKAALMETVKRQNDFINGLVLDLFIENANHPRFRGASRATMTGLIRKKLARKATGGK